MSGAQAWNDAIAILEDATGAGHVSPAAAILVGRGDDVLFEHCAGVAGPSGRAHPCDCDTVFDVASLTKPLVTTALAFDLIARGRLGFDTRVADIVPVFAEHPERETTSSDERRLAVSVRDLLRHDSGLPAHRHYYEDFDSGMPGDAGEAERRRNRMFLLALTEPLERDPRSGSVYSDIGFLVLGAVIEKVAGARIDDLARERLFEPLGLEDARFIDLVAGAPAEFVERCASAGSCPWRDREVHGFVQDQNAFAMGGVATHAGLFATARTVHRLAGEWIHASSGKGRVLDRRIVGHAWNRAAAAAGAAPSTWALGWDTPTPGASTAGSRIGPGAVGHLGYTGTSLWIDPSTHVHVVLLTNRIAYGSTPDGIRALRPKVHDAVFAALERTRL